MRKSYSKYMPGIEQLKFDHVAFLDHLAKSIHSHLMIQ